VIAILNTLEINHAGGERIFPDKQLPTGCKPQRCGRPWLYIFQWIRRYL